MDRAVIIKRALLKLGMPFNNKNLEEDSLYKAASFLLDNDQKGGGILRELLVTSTFSFNLKKCFPSLVKEQENRYEYNKPKGYLDYVWSSHPVEEVGEKLFSRFPKLEIMYKENIDLAKLPPQAQQLIILKLAYELAGTANQSKTLGVIYEEMERVRADLEAIGGVQVVNPYEDYDYWGGSF